MTRSPSPIETLEDDVFSRGQAFTPPSKHGPRLDRGIQYIYYALKLFTTAIFRFSKIIVN